MKLKATLLATVATSLTLAACEKPSAPSGDATKPEGTASPAEEIMSADVHPEFWVSPGGSDTSPGTREQPFQTVLRARDELRAKRKPGEGGTIWIGKGEYPIQETIALTKEDSGSEKAPLVIRAVPDERVSLFGGVRLPRSAFAPVEDRAILARIIDEQAREKLVAVDLRRHGITDFGEHSLRGFTRGLPNKVGKIMPVELSVGGQRMRVARWPNPGVSYAQWLPPFQEKRPGVVGRPLNAVLDAGPNAGVLNTDNPPSPDYFDRGGTFRYEFDRPTLWKEADDVWLDGVLSFSWAWTYNKVARFDTEKKTITMRYGDPYGIMDTYSHNFFFFENLLEEIDQPGEYWIDRKNGILYYYPVAAFFEPEIEIIISQLKKPFFTVTDARHVTFRDFTMESSRGGAVIVRNGTAVRFEQMELRNIGGNGLSLQGSSLEVVRCHISQIGQDAIILDSGNARKLVPGNSLVEDCHINHWGYHQRVYRYAIRLSDNSCGNRIVRNVLHDSPHSAILLAGNDNVIEYNRMHDVVLEFTDMGAIYGNTGANPLSRGNIIRQNYFHDLGRVPYAHGMPAVYPDWGTMGWTLEQNVFARIGLGDEKMLPSECILINSSPHIIMRNNVFVNCAIPIRYSSYTGRTGMTVLTSAWERNFPEAEMARFSLHLSRYPELKDFYREPRQFPTTSLWAQNLVVNTPSHPLYSEKNHVMQDGAIDECKTLQITNNAVISSDPGFVDMASGDFQLHSNSVAFQLIPGFAAPDFAAMTTHVLTGPFQSVEYVWRPRNYEPVPVAGQPHPGDPGDSPR
jgi:hypothetical protein